MSALQKKLCSENFLTYFCSLNTPSSNHENFRQLSSLINSLNLVTFNKSKTNRF